MELEKKVDREGPLSLGSANEHSIRRSKAVPGSASRRGEISSFSKGFWGRIVFRSINPGSAITCQKSDKDFKLKKIAIVAMLGFEIPQCCVRHAAYKMIAAFQQDKNFKISDQRIKFISINLK